jgi:hypothetical protein
LPLKNRLIVDLWYPKALIFLCLFSFIAKLYRGNREMSTSFLQIANFFYLSSANLYIKVDYDLSEANK